MISPVYSTTKRPAATCSARNKPQPRCSVRTVFVLGDASRWNGRLPHAAPHGHTRGSHVVNDARLKHSGPHPTRGIAGVVAFCSRATSGDRTSAASAAADPPAASKAAAALALAAFRLAAAARSASRASSAAARIASVGMHRHASTSSRGNGRGGRWHTHWHRCSVVYRGGLPSLRTSYGSLNASAVCVSEGADAVANAVVFGYSVSDVKPGHFAEGFKGGTAVSRVSSRVTPPVTAPVAALFARCFASLASALSFSAFAFASARRSSVRAFASAFALSFSAFAFAFSAFAFAFAFSAACFSFRFSDFSDRSRSL